MSAPALSLDDQEQLIDEIGATYDDPLAFVLYVYPWGEPGTFLADEDGPDTWQAEELTALGEQVIAAEAEGKDARAIQRAVASGHGVGKTALVAWVIHWFVSTREHPQVVVTSNTETQLNTKTWRELSKWHGVSLHKHWFRWTATKFMHVDYPTTWFASAIPWTEHNSESFAGTHEKHVLIVFDEASTIADVIWEVTDGALTTPGAIRLAFGNPTRSHGRFRECFGRFAHRWQTRHVDARTAKKANARQLQDYIDDYGEDHDFCRIRVRGVFPRTGSMQLIGGGLVLEAVKREAVGYERLARIMGVDIARHGEDESAICYRQGQFVWPIQRMRIPDTMQLAYRINEAIREFDPDVVFLDATGMGWGVADRLSELNVPNVIPVQVGEAADDDAVYFNKRTEIWVRTRDWLKGGGQLPADPQLERDLTGPQYTYDRRERMQLESKKDMKRRDPSAASPDSGDSLALTFTSNVGPAHRPKAETWRDKLVRQSRAASPMTA